MAVRLDDEPEIISLARTLKLDPGQRSVEEILRYCRQRVAGWAGGPGKIKTIAELEALVCRRLHMVIEEVWSDADLGALITKYIGLGEKAFASLRVQLDEDTFATTMERYSVRAGAPDQYVAIIDCRGQKAARRFFSRWHEIAHMLTLVGQLELPFHRSTTEQSPMERLMDAIAGEVGFYDSIIQPALHAELSQTGHLTFAGVQRVRDAAFPDASYAATLIACIKRDRHPLVHVEAGLAHKKAEASQLRSRQMNFFPVTPPVAKLRAIKATPNQAAKEVGFLIHQNMQIPPASMVAAHFAETEGIDMTDGVGGIEDLSIWVHSDGTPIGQGPVRVQARRIAGVLTVLIQRLEAAT